MNKTITQFRWLVTMLLLVTAMAMPKMAWAQISPTMPSGNGTADSPYKIGTAAELYWFAALVNGDESVCTGNVTQKTSANAVLTKDIDYGYITWTPIGVNGYTGTFDGQGHTISGLNFDNSGLNNVGLFGSNSGTIKNVGVVNSYFYGSDFVGGVCGYNEGTITGCYNTGSVSGNDWVGGVCGQNYGGTITSCYNTGTASGNNWVGGVCGSNSGTITSCYNTGTVSGDYYVGGVCGDHGGIITGCNNKGSVSGDYYVGGVCGDNNGGTITSCHNTGEVSGNDDYVGGVCGDNENGGTITSCHNTGQVHGYKNCVGGVCGGNSSTITSCYNDNTGAVSGNGGSVGGVCGSNSGTITSCYNTGTVSCNFDSVGGVCGSNGGKITGCYNTGSVSGHNQVGGVCGYNSSTITGCYNYNTGAVSGSKDVSGSSYVGGVCGYNEGGTITGCYNSGTVSGYNWIGGVCGRNSTGTITGCYNTGEVSGNSNIGGVCGDNERGTITGCYTNNDVVCGNDNGTLDDCGKKTNDDFKNGTVCPLLNDALKDANASVRFYRGTNYPELIMNVPSLAEGKYQISNKEELYAFALLVNNGETNANAELTADIVVNSGLAEGKTMLESLEYDVASGKVTNGSSFVAWTPMGYYKSDDDYVEYKGTFDGQGHTISGLYLDNRELNNVGLFGRNSGTIKNVGVIDSYFCGNNQVGGVCGNNVNGGTISDCYNMGSVSGNNLVGGVCGENGGTITNCYYLASNDDGNGGKTTDQFKSGEVAYLLSQGSTVTDGENTTYYSGSVWGQQLGTDNYPVLSDYKVIKAAKGDKDANENDTYWATFSNLNSDVTLSVPSARNLKVYNATVSGGTLTLSERTDSQVAKGEGVLLKTDKEYVNAKENETDGLTAVDYADNNLVATPATEQTITAEADYTLYRLTYNNVSTMKDLGFYLGLVKDANGNVISSNGSQLKATPGKAYLKVSTDAATTPTAAAPAHGFVFPGDDETTGIGEIVIEGDAGISGTANANDRIYNLQGQQISAPVKGIYIKNNKKVIIK